jgi:hypothetical protein
LANGVSSNGKTVTTDEYFQNFCREILDGHDVNDKALAIDPHDVNALDNKGAIITHTFIYNSTSAALM